MGDFKITFPEFKTSCFPTVNYAPLLFHESELKTEKFPCQSVFLQFLTTALVFFLNNRLYC